MVKAVAYIHITDDKRSRQQPIAFHMKKAVVKCSTENMSGNEKARAIIRPWPGIAKAWFAEAVYCIAQVRSFQVGGVCQSSMPADLSCVKASMIIRHKYCNNMVLPE